MIAQQLFYDVLIQILVLLPVKSVFRFKVVSKVWNVWLSDPSFRHKFLGGLDPSSLSALPLLGFFEVCNGRYRDFKSRGYLSRPAFLPTSKQGRRMPKGHRRLGFFLSSSNGLILCGYHPMKYYVCNPLTNQRFSLPPPPYNPFDEDPTAKIFVSVAFSHNVYDGSYIVVRAEAKFRWRKTLGVLIFSSRDGDWDKKKCVVRAPTLFALPDNMPGIESGGIIFWPVWGNSIAAYDPSNVKDKLWMIQIPQSSNDYFTYPCCTVLPDGRLQYAFDDFYSISIYVLKERMRSYSYSDVIPVSEWEKKVIIYYYSVEQLFRIVDYTEITFGLVGFHPQNPNIIYKRLGCEVYQITWDNDTLKWESVPFSLDAPCTFKFFPILIPYVLPIWPHSPFPSPSA